MLEGGIPSEAACSAIPCTGPSTAHSPILVSATEPGSSFRSIRSSNAAIRVSSDFSPVSRSCWEIVDVVATEEAHARTRKDYTVMIRSNHAHIAGFKAHIVDCGEVQGFPMPYNG